MASLKHLHLFLLSVWVFLSCNLLQGCTPSAQPMAPPVVPAMPVELGTATEKILDDASTFVATLKSRKSVNLKPQIEGRVLQIQVKSGDIVAAGKPLMVLDKSKQESQVANSDAAIESAIADENNALATLKSLKATRLSKVGNLEFAAAQFKRYKTLNADGAVSAESMDEKRNNYTIAQAELGAVDAQIAAQEAQVARCQKQITGARAAKQGEVEQLKYFTVKAPFSGMIGDVPVRVGDYVTTDTMLTTVDQTKPLEVYLNIPTTESHKLRIGLLADIVDDTGKSIETGKISFISSQVDNNQQTVLTKAELPNSTGRFRSGQTVNCRVVWGRTTAVTIPVTSVTRFSGQDFVFVAKKGKDGKLVASQRSVVLGPIKGNEYKVNSGVNAGDQVVTSGIQNLADGVPISPSS